METIDIEKALKELTTEEKAGLCSGADFWHTKAVERLNIPDIMVSDGPHGIRKQEGSCDHMGVAKSVEAVCFPTASALACTFDRDLIYEVGEALGDECQAEGISTLLGPGANMKRSPLCGRNFEYFSEDPYVAGELGASMVNGIQSKGIGTSVKHFAANNQEYRRMSTEALVDERTLREIYLAAYETIVKKSQPTTIMCSYNRINGVYSCENDWLLNKVLRDEWGFKGLVMTDWGAMNRRVPALKAGLDLEMPSSHGETDKQIAAAINDGSLDENILDTAVRRILTLVNHYYENKAENASYDKEAHHELARKTAAQAAVLLKNDGVLPLKKSTKVAFIGEFAMSPRIQGGGSSHINCFKTSSALEAASGYDVTFAKGYDTSEDKTDEALIAEAVEAAKACEAAIVFAGLPDSFESEGYDRTHMNLPDCQNKLIHEIAKVQPNVAVVLHNGSPVTMPWLNDVGAVLEMYLSGQACGEAAVDLLFGDANPCGKLAETFPLRVQDNPSYLNFPGERDSVSYAEGLFIGYRYYDTKEMEVLFPFGHGLSYTTFSYDNMQLNSSSIKDTDELTVSVSVTNTGKLAGSEILQLYVADRECTSIRPKKELKGFSKVFLEPGETKTIFFSLDKRSFAYYNVKLEDWFVESGDFDILIGASSRDIRCKQTVYVEGTVRHPFHAGDITTCGDIFLYAKDTSPLKKLLEKSAFGSQNLTDDDELGAGTGEMMRKMFEDTPLHSIISFDGGGLTIEDIKDTIQSLNNQ